MTVTDKAWQSYIKKLSAINRKAAKIMQDWISVNGLDYPEELISYAYGIVGKYGEAAGALACEMYDTLARAQGKILPDAVPAEPATYSEVARAVIGTKKERPGQVPDTVARLVKQTAADTTLQNAKRDGAQFAWIPHGDTCSFCITLASRGWQYMSKNALKNGHAEHIHANCDCEYGVRFDGKSNVAGYDPDKYLEQYNNAEGTKPQDKINSMRREQYAKDADKINARRRELYAEKKEAAETKDRLQSGNNDSILTEADSVKRITAIPASTIHEKIESGEYSLKLSTQNYNKHLEGHPDYERYKNSRSNKGLSPQSVLTISKDDTQRIIKEKSGTGIIRTRKDGSAMNIEDITCDEVIGAYWFRGQYVETNKAAIHYGRNGAHLVPHHGDNYD